MNKKITVIGAAIMDINAGPVSKDIFELGSVPADRMKMSYGGDALNEATDLAVLGAETELISVVGNDEIGDKVLTHLKECGINTDKVTVSDDMTTGMNIVLTDKEGERYFITNPDSSLRKLATRHILPYLGDAGDIVSFASMFVSPMLGTDEMLQVFREIKKKPGRILVSDMTTAKKGEKVSDIVPLLELADYIIPNEKEAAILTGETDPVKSMNKLSEYGAGCVIIKCGKDGCIYKKGDIAGRVAAFDTRAVDTTGAGDGFTAGFIYGLVNNMDLHDCCKMGCATASFIVENTGSLGNLEGRDQVFDRLKDQINTK